MIATKKTEIVPVQHLRLSDAVASQLQDLIRSGHFGDDGRLPSERELADQFGVGRGSMREAMRRLEALGILVKNQGVGTFVVDAKGDAASKTTAIELLNAGDVSAEELFQVRHVLEPFTAELAAQRRVPSDLRDLERTLADSTRDTTAADFVALDFQFHSMIAGASKNRLLAQLYQHLQPHHANYSLKVVSIAGRMEKASEGHAKILQAIADGNEQVARKEALAHLRLAEKDLLRELAKVSDPEKE